MHILRGAKLRPLSRWATHWNRHARRQRATRVEATCTLNDGRRTRADRCPVRRVTGVLPIALKARANHRGTGKREY